MFKVTALILAAGMGTRMGGVSKARLLLCGAPALIRSALAFDAASTVSDLVIAARADDVSWINENLANFGIRKPCKVVPGGDTRQASAKAAFEASPEADFVAFHDGARPLVTPEGIDTVVRAAFSSGAAVAATAVTDTVKRSNGGVIASTVDRDGLFTVQTPQVFSRKIYSEALAAADGVHTDDCGLCERIGARITLVDIGKDNIKLTDPRDVALAEAVLKKRGDGMLFIGHGYDAHKLVEGRPLVLGGVTVPFEKGLDGHSDADVLLHAVMDALLGSAALGDIGKHFPPSDPSLEGISSMTLLSRTARILSENGFAVSNIDATLIAQRPKLSPYVEAMRENIASVLSVPPERVSVKATTEEGMGFTGSGEGISAHAVCMTLKI